jgi:hypothetical protein
MLIAPVAGEHIAKRRVAFGGEGIDQRADGIGTLCGLDGSAEDSMPTLFMHDKVFPALLSQE